MVKLGKSRLQDVIYVYKRLDPNDKIITSSNIGIVNKLIEKLGKFGSVYNNSGSINSLSYGIVYNTEIKL